MANMWLMHDVYHLIYHWMYDVFVDVAIGDVDVVELHDCFSANELLTYEALGLCSEGYHCVLPM